MNPPRGWIRPSGSELWSIISGIRNTRKLSVLFTTHLLEEAEPADEILLLDQGRCVASGPVADLRSSLGKGYVRLGTYQPKKLAAKIRKEGEIETTVEPAAVKVVPVRGAAAPLAIRLWRRYGKEVTSVTLCRPTLRGSSIQKTGRPWSSPGGNFKCLGRLLSCPSGSDALYPAKEPGDRRPGHPGDLLVRARLRGGSAHSSEAGSRTPDRLPLPTSSRESSS
jgi:hypothetical protein